MIERTLNQCPALERLLAVDNSRKFSKAQNPLMLALTDWNTLGCISRIFCVFVHTTEFASCATYPTLGSQLPYYKFLQNALHELIVREPPMEHEPDSTSTSYKICSPAHIAYQKLNQYRIKTDLNMGQVITTIAYSQMKLQLFKNLQSEATWTENALERFMRIFNKRYVFLEPMAMPTESNEIEVIASTQRRLLPSLESPRNRRRYEDQVFCLSDNSQE